MRLSGGSAVVRMRNAAQAAAAIAALNGAVPDGGWQQLTVRAAETAEQRSSRISAINGRQQGTGGPAPTSPLQVALPPAGPGGAGAAAALRRVHSARGAGSHGSLQCYTAGLAADSLGGALPAQLRRGSLDWQGTNSMDSSRRSSMDVARCGSSAAMLHAGAGRTSSDSGSGSGSDDLPPIAAAALAGAEAGAGAGMGRAEGELQRMLLEAVLALLGQVESGQLSLVRSGRGGLRPAFSSGRLARWRGRGPHGWAVAGQQCVPAMGCLRHPARMRVSLAPNARAVAAHVFPGLAARCCAPGLCRHSAPCPPYPLFQPAMRSALESALAAAKQQPAGGEDPPQAGSPGAAAPAQQGPAQGPFRPT